MNIIEKQTALTKTLYEINTQAMNESVELSRRNIEQYVEVNRAFAERLPEVREVGSFVSLQREYGETLWNNAKDAMESQNAILQSAMEEAREAVKSAFTPIVAEVEAVVAPKAKAKAKKAKAA